MYHPHGRPNGVDVHAHAFEDTFGGASTSKEDIYWILYAPRTSTNGAARGRQKDGYVMAAGRTWS